MAEGRKKFEIADDTRTKARSREVQILLNIVDPDPEYQPFVLIDEAWLFDAVGTGEDEILRRLALYSGVIFHFPCANLSGNLWMKLSWFIQTGPTIGFNAV
jgi:hypothetical protein